ncbi:MAG: glycosyltransferase, partial [Chthoniobacterales bacterium]
MKRPRVLFVSHESTLTGAPLQLLYLVRWLQRDGWDLAVATPETGPIVDSLIADGVSVVIHPRLLEEDERGKLRELCAEYDVVVANTIIAWPAVRAARAAGKRVIWYLHETLVAVRLMREIAEMMPTLDLATLLVTPTRQTARIFQDLTPTTIEVVPYGIPAPSIAARNNKNGRKAFITMASLEPRKGQDILVQAIKLLPKDLQASATFRIVGRPLEPIFCEKLRADAAGINAIEFTGELNHVRSLELLAASDALVCSSRDETMPLAILEAMSLGKVVISTDVGGIAEWVRDEMNGLLVERDNPAALARALERCLENEGLTKRLRTGAQRTYARHFTLERFAQHFARLLIDLAPASRVRDANIATGYAEWLQQTEKIDHARLRRRLRRMRREPLISVLLPVYNPNLELLKVAIDSIKSQVYENWQLCIADDASTDASVRPFLEGQARDENRIKLTFRERNGHISACSNSALRLATGEWCALLDQDDVVAAEALACVAIEIDRHPDAGLIYSDEDKIDRAGKRSEPFFKTDWNPELFFGQNYINHLGVYRSDLLRSIGGFREGLEGSQDYDLALRCLELLRPEQVRHIPHILYHWRAVAGSLAAVVDAKPYAKEAARRAIGDSLRRRKITARVEACPE